MGAFIELVTVLFSNIVVMISVLGPTPGVSSYPLASQHASSSLPRLLGQNSGKHALQKEHKKRVIRPFQIEKWSQMTCKYFGSWVEYYFTQSEILDISMDAFHSKEWQLIAPDGLDSLKKELEQEELEENIVLFIISSSGKMIGVKIEFNSKEQDGKQLILSADIETGEMVCKLHYLGMSAEPKTGGSRFWQKEEKFLNRRDIVFRPRYTRGRKGKDEKNPSETTIGGEEEGGEEEGGEEEGITYVFTAEDSGDEASGSFTDTGEDEDEDEEKKGEDEEREAEVNISSSIEISAQEKDTFEHIIKKALGDKKGQIFVDRLSDYSTAATEFFENQTMTGRPEHRAYTGWVENTVSDRSEAYHLVICLREGTVTNALFIDVKSRIPIAQLQVDENGFAYLYSMKR